MVKYRRLLSLSTRTDVSVSFLPQLESHWFHSGIYQQSTVRKPPGKCTSSRQVVLRRPFPNRTINGSVCVYPCHILKKKIVGVGGVNICFHISTKEWAIWCLNRLRLNWNATNIYSNVNQALVMPLVMCACLEVQTTYNRELFCEAMMFWRNNTVRHLKCISNRDTQRKYSSKPLKRSIVKHILVFKR